MLRRNKWKILFTSVVTLLPILAGVILWDKLPDRMPSHWGVSGQVDGYLDKPVAVFALPFVLLAVHLVCVIMTAIDPKADRHPSRIIDVVLCICPLMSVLLGCITYAVALGAEVNVATIVLAVCAALFIVIGNYLPKCERNYTVGIKVSWALESDENWNATHRFAGKVWVVGGFIALVSAFLPMKLALCVYIPVTILTAVLPVCYSYLYYRRRKSAE